VAVAARLLASIESNTQCVSLGIHIVRTARHGTARVLLHYAVIFGFYRAIKRSENGLE
jgi:hypothetical protein